MTDLLQEFIDKLVREENEKAILETQKNFAIKLLKNTELTEVFVADAVELPLDEVKKLSKEIRKSKVAN